MLASRRPHFGAVRSEHLNFIRLKEIPGDNCLAGWGMLAAAVGSRWQLQLVSMCLLLLLPQSVGELHLHSAPHEHTTWSTSKRLSGGIPCFALRAAAGAIPASVRKTPAALLLASRGGRSFGASGERRRRLYDIYAHGVADKELLGKRSNASEGSGCSTSSKMYDMYAHSVRDYEVYGAHYGPSPGHTWAAEAVVKRWIREVKTNFPPVHLRLAD